MERIFSKMPHPALLLPLSLSLLIFLTDKAQAQERMSGRMSCPMCGGMGWGGMIIGVLMMIAVLAVLIALVVFLIRRSRSAH